MNDTQPLPAQGQTFQYNNPGDVIRYGNNVYEWDAAGMMTQNKLDTGGNTNGFRYLYTADNERVAVRNWNSTTGVVETSYFLRDLGNQVLREYRYVGTSKNWARDYTYQNGLMLTVERPTGTLWPILDQIGTPITYQDASHANNQFTAFLFAFGEDQATKDPSLIGSPKRFTGHERDQNLSLASFKDDLDYMHARYYSPHLARFLSFDPAGGRAEHPLSWNRFAYTYGNPVVQVDPTGMMIAVTGPMADAFRAMMGQSMGFKVVVTGGYLSREPGQPTDKAKAVLVAEFDKAAASNRTITINAEGDHPDVQVDKFCCHPELPDRTVSVTNLNGTPESAPAGEPQTSTRGELLTHILGEYTYGSEHGFTDLTYGPAHEAGRNAQNMYRAALGQKPVVESYGIDGGAALLIQYQGFFGGATKMTFSPSGAITGVSYVSWYALPFQ